MFVHIEIQIVLLLGVDESELFYSLLKFEYCGFELSDFQHEALAFILIFHEIVFNHLIILFYGFN